MQTAENYGKISMSACESTSTFDCSRRDVLCVCTVFYVHTIRVCLFEALGKKSNNNKRIERKKRASKTAETYTK